MLVAQVKKSSAITENIEKPLNEFIKNARKENLSDDEISTLVQQYLSINNKEMTK